MVLLVGLILESTSHRDLFLVLVVVAVENQVVPTTVAVVEVSEYLDYLC